MLSPLSDLHSVCSSSTSLQFLVTTDLSCTNVLDHNSSIISIVQHYRSSTLEEFYVIKVIHFNSSTLQQFYTTRVLHYRSSTQQQLYMSTALRYRNSTYCRSSTLQQLRVLPHHSSSCLQ
ncbi:hypothetical protein EB796_021724 [Bugula neritina]|uniref:Uncharacterized protein n=1 Tax=Bugula neritina TaxID=10212 RepID=A0A7J7J1C3_BUGNE|nr:hypothetical protein EB796_021724 [Bugula neritina]